MGFWQIATSTQATDWVVEKPYPFRVWSFASRVLPLWQAPLYEQWLGDAPSELCEAGQGSRDACETMLELSVLIRSEQDSLDVSRCAFATREWAV